MTTDDHPYKGYNRDPEKPLNIVAYFLVGLSMMVNIQIVYSTAPYALIRFKLPYNVLSMFVRRMASSLEFWCLPSMLLANILYQIYINTHNNTKFFATLIQKYASDILVFVNNLHGVTRLLANKARDDIAVKSHTLKKQSAGLLVGVNEIQTQAGKLYDKVNGNDLVLAKLLQKKAEGMISGTKALNEQVKQLLSQDGQNLIKANVFQNEAKVMLTCAEELDENSNQLFTKVNDTVFLTGKLIQKEAEVMLSEAKQAHNGASSLAYKVNESTVVNAKILKTALGNGEDDGKLIDLGWKFYSEAWDLYVLVHLRHGITPHYATTPEYAITLQCTRTLKEVIGYEIQHGLGKALRLLATATDCHEDLTQKYLEVITQHGIVQQALQAVKHQQSLYRVLSYQVQYKSVEKAWKCFNVKYSETLNLAETTVKTLATAIGEDEKHGLQLSINNLREAENSITDMTRAFGLDFWKVQNANQAVNALKYAYESDGNTRILLSQLEDNIGNLQKTCSDTKKQAEQINALTKELDEAISQKGTGLKDCLSKLNSGYDSSQMYLKLISQHGKAEKAFQEVRNQKSIYQAVGANSELENTQKVWTTYNKRYQEVQIQAEATANKLKCVLTNTGEQAIKLEEKLNNLRSDVESERLKRLTQEVGHQITQLSAHKDDYESDRNTRDLLSQVTENIGKLNEKYSKAQKEAKQITELTNTLREAVGEGENGLEKKMHDLSNSKDPCEITEAGQVLIKQHQSIDLAIGKVQEQQKLFHDVDAKDVLETLNNLWKTFDEKFKDAEKLGQKTADNLAIAIGDGGNNNNLQVILKTLVQPNSNDKVVESANAFINKYNSVHDLIDQLKKLSYAYKAGNTTKGTYSQVIKFVDQVEDKYSDAVSVYKRLLITWPSIIGQWLNFIIFVILLIVYVTGGEKGNVTRYYVVISISGFICGINLVLVYAVDYRYLVWYILGENSFPIVTLLINYVTTAMFGHHKDHDSHYSFFFMEISIAIIISLLAATVWTLAFLDYKTPIHSDTTPTLHLISPVLMVIVGMGLVYAIYPNIVPGLIGSEYLIDRIAMIIMLFAPVPIAIIATLKHLKIGDYWHPMSKWTGNGWFWHIFDIFIPLKIFLAVIFIYSLHHRDSRIARSIINKPKMTTTLTTIFYMCHSILLAVGFTGIIGNGGANYFLLPTQFSGALLSVFLEFYSIGYVDVYKRHDPLRWPTDGMSSLKAFGYWTKMACNSSKNHLRDLFTKDLRRDLLLNI
ncbi:Tpr family protein [Theileria parva strain Muguga]|uniref:Uncharacterized protein n=1 Tax=Theileria parva TaxID=5875 RepID=Q4N1Y7_THEPA|nr:uncharacterized protein TpMuguga_04g00590 [Theileria parva strain Muguga]EAN31942.1 Tpr family protein [Theileria parva strain Muguga]|eukprot:XP_764225.1 hypothetical protein [Theileria parva strain Muguga]